jgi:hypothetical protein
MERLVVDAEMVGMNIRDAFSLKNPEAMKDVIAELDRKTKLLDQAMKEYGFTWQDMGEKARGAKLGDLFTTLWEKTQVLRSAGIDYSEILTRQAKDYSGLVQAAIKTGTEVPVAMKPVLEDLLKMGTLLDENGQAFTDLSQITWATTLTKGFQQVTDAIHELTNALTNGVGGALDSLSHRPPVRIPIKFLDAEMATAATGGVVGMGRVLPFAMGGAVGSDTVPALLTPGEIVLNAAQQRNVGRALGGSTTLNVTVHAPGADRNDADAIAERVSNAVLLKLRREQRLNVA